MRKAKFGVFFFALFLSFDSFGLASLTQFWVFNVVPQPNLSIQKLPIPEHLTLREDHDNLLGFDYRSWRRIQTSA